MADVSSVSVSQLVNLAAEQLKSVASIKAPEWVSQVKSGSHTQRTIEEPDFWFKRCASILINASKDAVGVRRLQRKYGGARAHLVRRSHHRAAGGKIIRVAMQQLEAAGLLKKEKHGRTASPAGLALLSKAAAKA